MVFEITELFVITELHIYAILNVKLEPREFSQILFETRLECVDRDLAL